MEQHKCNMEDRVRALETGQAETRIYASLCIRAGLCFWEILKDRTNNIAVPIVAEYNGKITGYVNVYINTKPNPYVNANFCEIIDFGVFKKYRRHGIGSKLMDIAEEIVAKYSNTVYLSVGLHSGYGSAQRMYIKRGYIPDGLGVKYGDSTCEPYRTYCIDDDLVLCLSKKLE